MPLDENLIATLETSLRQTRKAQNRLMAQLREAEDEVKNLREEIEALENSAAQTESAIDSILVTMRSGNRLTWREPDPEPPRKPRISRDEQYDFEFETRFREPKRSNRSDREKYSDESESSYRSNNSVAYLSQNRVPSIGSNIVPVSHRFSDRTITQACTLLLREYGKAMHVNELYNLLVAGGMEFTGNNPTISIAVSLNRNTRRFKKVAPGTFDVVMREAKQAS